MGETIGSMHGFIRLTLEGGLKCSNLFRWHEVMQTFKSGWGLENIHALLREINRQDKDSSACCLLISCFEPIILKEINVDYR